MTDADAERQLQRVDEFAARLKTRAALVFVAVVLAAVLVVPAVLSWLPLGWWNVPGSFLPLIATATLVTGISWLVLRAARARRCLNAQELIPEIETSTGLRRGELEGALELSSVPRGASATLARRQRARVAGQLTGRTDSDLAPTRERESRRRLWLSATISALSVPLSSESRIAAAVALTTAIVDARSARFDSEPCPGIILISSGTWASTASTLLTNPSTSPPLSMSI